MTAIIVAFLVIVIVEGFLWRLFRWRTKDVISWEEGDTPLSRFIRVGRIDIFAIIHTLILLIIIESFLFFTW